MSVPEMRNSCGCNVALIGEFLREWVGQLMVPGICEELFAFLTN
jgi:hypothetical protein